MATFDMTPEQAAKADEWVKAQLTDKPKNSGAIGGRFSYEFTPTGLGMCVEVIDNIPKDRLELTDFSDW